jgi:hypothetical protein
MMPNNSHSHHRTLASTIPHETMTKFRQQTQSKQSELPECRTTTRGSQSQVLTPSSSSTDKKLFQAAAVVSPKSPDSKLPMMFFGLDGASKEEQHGAPLRLVQNNRITTRFLPEVTSCSTGLRAFPFQLHAMLNNAEPIGFTNIVSWEDNGSSFKVHDKTLFARDVLPAFFQGQTKYKSFQRQRKYIAQTRI